MSDDPTVPTCTPHFIPSSTGCVLPSEDETKSRLLIGGTLFRSRNPGFGANDISISCIWETADGNPPVAGCPSNIVNIILTVVAPGYTQDYTVVQTVICESPINWTSAIPTLRINLAADPLSVIDLPDSDIQTPGEVAGTTWTSAEDAEFLSEFTQTSLSGGTGISDSPTQTELDVIRTGPGFTLTNIRLSEKTTNDGSMVSINKIRYWGGSPVSWQIFDSVNPPTGCSS